MLSPLAETTKEPSGLIAQALTVYRDEVISGDFPAPEHTVDMPDEEWEALLEEVEG